MYIQRRHDRPPPPLPSNDESQLMENGGNQSFLSKAIHKMV